ncbi:sulfotransferase family 2 domain-containing protein [Rapidithrix thailandica]|uniref:Sulfotransferase family 2 domain-containing protein n=1 Tax=Rapidithrix thailandica TaxID=413964 RepID=A0AAW9SGP4_9BACT
MLISHSKKFIFVHNFKVAGTSIRGALEKYTYKCMPQVKRMEKILYLLGYYPWIFTDDFEQHSLARELRGQLPRKIFRKYYKFGFVRNPWDWQVSHYTYICKSPHHYQYDLIRNMSGFEEYIHWRVNDCLELQKDFFYDTDGTCLVDFIGKFENLSQDFTTICQAIKVKSELPHLNKSKSSKYLNFYTPETIDLVYEAYQPDIKLFGYDKPELNRRAAAS